MQKWRRLELEGESRRTGGKRTAARGAAAQSKKDLKDQDTGGPMN
jgi:hypothetical protein